MWVTAFADVAELIMGVSLEEFSAFNDEGRKRVAWGIRGTKCNMTIAKTVGEMYTNYTVESMQFAGYLPWTLIRTRLVSSLEVWTAVVKRLNSRSTPERLYPFLLLVVSVLACTDCRTFTWQTFEFTNTARSTRSRTLVAIFASSRECITI